MIENLLFDPNYSVIELNGDEADVRELPGDTTSTRLRDVLTLTAWEFKWNSNKKARIPKTFTRAYPEARCSVVTPDNFMDFLTS